LGAAITPLITDPQLSDFQAEGPGRVTER